MDLIRKAIEQPVTVIVGVILLIMGGVIAITRIPVQLTPNVEDTIISVITTWEGASPAEIEQEIVDEQEQKLQGIANLRAMTSQSLQGQGKIRLEFNTGTDKDEALREVSDKLREVPEYPDTADEPVVEATDPENRDYIAWIVFGTTDPGLDIRTLQDFAEDRIKPILERVPGMSEIGVLGGREREAQIRFDPVLLAHRGITPSELVEAIRRTNLDVSAGELADAKLNVRLRTVSQFESVEEVEQTVIKTTTGGPVRVGDVAEVVETYKEPTSFVRSRSVPVIAINAQREVGSNVMEVMAGLRAAVAKIGEPGGILDAEARRRGLNGELSLVQVYDETIYIDQALDLVQENIWVGGLLASVALLIFLRSIRTVLMIVIATPVAVVGAIVAMVAMGRTINVISLAGMAFAIGMVIDNAIVVVENVYRHLEMGKRPMQAAYDGTREVWGALLAATLTNIVVFVPILLVEEEAGQLFRDIALAICATAALSLLITITVVPSAAARWLKPIPARPRQASQLRSPARWRRVLIDPFLLLFRWLGRSSDWLADFVYWACGSVMLRVLIVVGLTAASLVGSYMLMPPADYLPKGNRNLIFGLMIPPPGYNLDQQQLIGERVEGVFRPFWEAGLLTAGSPEYERAVAALPQFPVMDWTTGQVKEMVRPPPVENYFFVGFDQILFHGAIGMDDRRVVDLEPLFAAATRPELAPGVLAFAQQIPLFRLGGFTGNAVKVNFSGLDLDRVTAAASAAYMRFVGRYGVFTVQPDPSNFNIPGPELQVVPDRVRLGEIGLTPSDLGLAVQANGDGAIIGEYRIGGETIDLKLIARGAVDQKIIGELRDVPIATPAGAVVPLASLAEFRRITSPPQINRTGRQRSVTLQFTPPQELALETAIDEVTAMLADMRASGAIPVDVETSLTGSASKLQAVRAVLLGDGTLLGTLSSSLVLALIVTYLLMCVLFQSFLQPLVIMFSVPLATLGGFMALSVVYQWSKAERTIPDQQLDVLTMLGFIILIGVVVNNAILLVHQALNFMKGLSDAPGIVGAQPPRIAITESVRTRVRPILMSAITSVLGMIPLVVSPGAGSELYRGLGAVVLGGLLISTIFTLILVPLLMSLVIDAQEWFQKLFGRASQLTPEMAGASLPTRPTNTTDSSASAEPALLRNPK
jgi:HAE1 family hydrophobic/amphiphilic exporter-1